MTNKEYSIEHYNDHPIPSINEDLLNRAEFAKALADVIQNWSGKDSFAIGLCGVWGSGKSSLKNMILSHLQNNDYQIEILHFEPWQIINQEKLAEHFFDELRASIGKQEVSKDAEKSKKELRLHAAKLKVQNFYLETSSLVIKNIADLIKSIIPTLGYILAGVGFLTDKVTYINDWLPTILFICGGILIITPGILNINKWRSEKASVEADYYQALEEHHKLTLYESKKALNTVLKEELKKKILVVIDDIDRLRPNEILQIFQLVKANADFPNIMYLLLFDRHIVAKSLSTQDGINGHHYMEKILHAVYDLPEIERIQLEDFFIQKLNNMLGVFINSEEFNKEYWQNVFHGCIKYYFHNLRAVYRYLNTLSVYLNLFQNNGTLQVNPIDLIVLETFRVYEPSLYKAIIAHQTALARGIEEEKLISEARDTTINALLQDVPQEHRTRINNVLIEIFPVLSGRQITRDIMNKWQREWRVCHPDIFERYFRLFVSPQEHSKSEIDYILQSSNNAEKMEIELIKLHDQGKLYQALKILEAHVDEIPLENAVPFVTAILNIGDHYLSSEEKHFFSFSTEFQASRLLLWYLKRFDDKKEVTKTYKEAIQQSSGLFMPVKEIWGQDKREERNVSLELYLIPAEDMPDLRELCLEKIRKASKDTSLANNRSLALILYVWGEWSSIEEPRAWVRELIKTEHGIRLFLITMLSHSTTTSSIGVRYNYFIRISSLERYVELPEFFTTVKRMIEHQSDKGLTTKEQLAIKALYRAEERWGKGITEDQAFYDDDTIITEYLV